MTMQGVDLPIDSPPADYLKWVKLIKEDPNSLGAIITTHKINLFNAAKEIFDDFDTYARMFGELSCIAKSAGRLFGYALDPVSSKLAMRRFLPDDLWAEKRGEALLFGAGGSALAVGAALLNKDNGHNVPSKIILTDINENRLIQARQKLAGLNPNVQIELSVSKSTLHNEECLGKLKPYSLIVNATGMGKDIPGSPISDRAIFPENSFVWELNYRGDLTFRRQAMNQQHLRALHIEDGWVYFVYGWIMCIAKIGALEIDDGMFERLEKIALERKSV
ncbi:shikimate dehydrogenase [Cohnella faecalis]